MKPKITLNSDDAIKTYLYSIWGGKTFKLEMFRLPSFGLNFVAEHAILLSNSIKAFQIDDRINRFEILGCNSFIGFILKYFKVHVIDALHITANSDNTIERMIQFTDENSKKYYSNDPYGIPPGTVIVDAYYRYEYSPNLDHENMTWGSYYYYPNIVLSSNGTDMALTVEFSTGSVGGSSGDLIISGTIELIPKETT